MERDALYEALGPLPFPSFWTLDELARLLGLDSAEVKRMRSAHELPSFFVGGQWLISTADLIRWLLLQRERGGERNGRTRRRQ
jgi:excisionase family DNA binding protein